MPIVEPDKPASRWALSHLGRARCRTLADRLSEFDAAAVYASSEPKAMQTAKLVADRLGASVRIHSGLEEHHRDGAPFFHGPDEFEDAVARLFANPYCLVYGSETANQALTRFDHAIGTIIDSDTGPDVVVVAHGTVTTLFLAKYAGVHPLETWRSLGLPSYAVLALLDFALLDIVTDIT